MTVKSEIAYGSSNKLDRKLPILRRDIENGLVVLFEKAASISGTVLHPGETKWNIGDHWTSWSIYSRAEFWEVLPPGTQVILEQE